MIPADGTTHLSSASFGMDLLRLTGHTSLKEAVFSDRSVEQLFYHDIQSSIVLTPSDWVHLNQILNVSFLFAITSEDFTDRRSDSGLDYFAVVLDCSIRDRSAVAYEVHRILSRLSSASFTIVISLWQDNAMISWAVLDSSREVRIAVSDWLSVDIMESSDVTERMNAAFFSHHSIPEFIQDLEYSLARPYYLSKEPAEYYAQFDFVPMDFASTHQGDYLNRETRIEMSRLACRSPKDQYGYDYLAPDQSSTDEEWYDADDTELLMYQFDHELAGAHDAENIEESIGPAERHESDEEGGDDVDIDDEILADPVETLLWLEQHDKYANKLPSVSTITTALPDELGFNVVAFLRSYKLEVIDKRSIGGALWVIGGRAHV